MLNDVCKECGRAKAWATSHVVAVAGIAAFVGVIVGAILF